jgi:hypothetical protein
MRVGVLLFVSLGLLVITGACGGPGPSDDACTSEGNSCVDLSLPHAPCTSVGSPCSGSNAGLDVAVYTCCEGSFPEGGVPETGSSTDTGTKKD